LNNLVAGTWRWKDRVAQAHWHAVELYWHLYTGVGACLLLLQRKPFPMFCVTNCFRL